MVICVVDVISSVIECNVVRSNCYFISWVKWNWGYYCGFVGRYCFLEINLSKMVGRKKFFRNFRDLNEVFLVNIMK